MTATRHWYEASADDYNRSNVSNAESDRLARRAKTDPRARERITRMYGGLALKIAMRIHRAAAMRGLEHEDLCQNAMLYFLQALDQWDPNRGGSSFRTYAYAYMYNGTLNYINDSSRVRTPRRVAELATAVLTGKRTLEDVVADGEVSAERLQLGMQSVSPNAYVYIDDRASVGDNDNKELVVDRMVDSDDIGWEDQVIRDMQLDDTLDALATMPDHQRRVLAGRHIYDRTYADMAEEEGVTSQAIMIRRNGAYTRARQAPEIGRWMVDNPN